MRGRPLPSAYSHPKLIARAGAASHPAKQTGARPRPASNRPVRMQYEPVVACAPFERKLRGAAQAAALFVLSAMAATSAHAAVASQSASHSTIADHANEAKSADIQDSAPKTEQATHSDPALIQDDITPSPQVDSDVLAANTTFSAGFIQSSISGGDADLSLFARSDAVLAGQYDTDVVLNGIPLGRKEIEFLPPTTSHPANFCLTMGLLKDAGLLVGAFPQLKDQKDDECVALASVVPQASARYDPLAHQLTLTIPQAYLSHRARDFVDPSQYDAGAPAALFTYRANGARVTSNGQSSTQAYLSVNSGLNIGAWHLRNQSIYNRDSAGDGKFQAIETYVDRPLPSLKSRLVIGDSATGNSVFDSVSFRGVQLGTDFLMRAGSEQGYAPVIRGVANSAARVTIRQRGYVIYTTYVAPGPFVISDLYPTGGSGDLEITVREADGSEHSFVQPYATVPGLEREGKFSYSVTAGRYRSGVAGSVEPWFAQATGAYGLAHQVTLYGGLLVAENYSAGALGVAKVLGDFGAIAADVTYSRTNEPGGRVLSGTSARVIYAKTFSTDTSLNLAAYRYSSKGYRSFADSIADQSPTSGVRTDKRGRFDLSISQSIGRSSNVYASLSRQTYWSGHGGDTTAQVALGTSYKNIALSVYASRTLANGATHTNASTQAGVTVSLPLGGSKLPMYGSYAMNHDSRTGALHQNVGLTGSALEDNRLSFGVQSDLSTGERGSRNAIGGGGSAQYVGRAGTVGGSYNYSRGSSQTSVQMEGSAVVHQHGVTLSQPITGAAVLVEAPGAAHVKIEGYSGVETDGRGYAVVPFAQPYHYNRIAFNATDLSSNTFVSETVKQVVPIENAVAVAKFNTISGRSALIRLATPENMTIPMGALVENDKGQQVGTVGPSQTAFVEGLSDKGTIHVSWEGRTAGSCAVRVEFPASTEQDAAYESIDAPCAPSVVLTKNPEPTKPAQPEYKTSSVFKNYASPSNMNWQQVSSN